MAIFSRIVGLTGGISSGKSTVSNRFRESGTAVVDANVFADAALNRGTAVYPLVVAAFGPGILRHDREVHRRRLRQFVSSDPNSRLLLDGLVASYTMFKVFCEIVRLWMEGHRVIVLDAPMLFEYKMDRLTDQIIVVWTNRETQIQLLMARRGMSEEVAGNLIDAEMSLDEKRDKASWTIVNNGSLDDLEGEFVRVFNEVTRPLTWLELLYSSLQTLLLIVFFIYISPFKAMK